MRWVFSVSFCNNKTWMHQIKEDEVEYLKHFWVSLSDEGSVFDTTHADKSFTHLARGQPLIQNETCENPITVIKIISRHTVLNK